MSTYWIFYSIKIGISIQNPVLVSTSKPRLWNHLGLFFPTSSIFDLLWRTIGGLAEHQHTFKRNQSTPCCNWKLLKHISLHFVSLCFPRHGFLSTSPFLTVLLVKKQREIQVLSDVLPFINMLNCLFLFVWTGIKMGKCFPFLYSRCWSMA